MSDVKSLTQFGTLYHGTAAVLKPGDTVQPTKPLKIPKTKIGAITTYRDTKIAFATTDLDEARAYAADRARSEGMLFGNVYKVSVNPDDPAKMRTVPSFVKDRKYVQHIRSERGFRVHSLVEGAS